MAEAYRTHPSPPSPAKPIEDLTMTTNSSNTFNPFDPTGMFKEMRDAQMDAWSKMMLELVNSEAYADSTGTLLDTWLTSSGPFNKAIETTMAKVLAQLNFPTRDDVALIAERLTNIEMRLDDLEAMLDERLRSAHPNAGLGAQHE